MSEGCGLGRVVPWRKGEMVAEAPLPFPSLSLPHSRELGGNPEREGGRGRQPHRGTHSRAGTSKPYIIWMNELVSSAPNEEAYLLLPLDQVAATAAVDGKHFRRRNGQLGSLSHLRHREGGSNGTPHTGTGRGGYLCHTIEGWF